MISGDERLNRRQQQQQSFVEPPDTRGWGRRRKNKRREENSKPGRDRPARTNAYAPSKPSSLSLQAPGGWWTAMFRSYHLVMLIAAARAGRRERNRVKQVIRVLYAFPASPPPFPGQPAHPIAPEAGRAHRTSVGRRGAPPRWCSIIVRRSPRAEPREEAPVPKGERAQPVG